MTVRLNAFKLFIVLITCGFFFHVALRSARTAGLPPQDASRAQPSAESLEFFEKKIRPVLADIDFPVPISTPDSH